MNYSNLIVWGEGFVAYAIADSLNRKNAVSWRFAVLLGCATSSFVATNIKRVYKAIGGVKFDFNFTPPSSSTSSSVAEDHPVVSKKKSKAAEPKAAEPDGFSFPKRGLSYSFIDGDGTETDDSKAHCISPNLDPIPVDPIPVIPVVPIPVDPIPVIPVDPIDPIPVIPVDPVVVRRIAPEDLLPKDFADSIKNM